MVEKEEMFNSLKALADQGDSEAMFKLARFYRNGWGVEKSMNDSLDCMRKAAAMNPKYYPPFYDALMKTTILKYKWEARDILFSNFTRNDDIKYRLGIAFIKGFGIERNIDYGLQLMKELSETGEKYRFAYVDQVLKTGISDFYRQAYQDCIKFLASGDSRAVPRLPRLYQTTSLSDEERSNIRDILIQNKDEQPRVFIDFVLENSCEDLYGQAYDVLDGLDEDTYSKVRKAELVRRMNGLDENAFQLIRSAAEEMKPWAVKYMAKMIDDATDLQSKYDICQAFCDYSSKDTAMRVFADFPPLDTGIGPVHVAEMDILKKFLYYCDKASVTPIADGGTLLGTVRHKGFIPWDDDFDFRMFVSDINKLERYMATVDGECYFIRETSRRKYRFLIHGFIAWIDVFPIQSLLIYEDHTFPVDEPVTMAQKDRYPGLLAVTYRSLNDCSILVTGPHFNEEQMFPLGKMPFEDVELTVPHDVDHVLSTFYGSYMYMPNEWHIHMDPEQLEEIDRSYRERSQNTKEVIGLGHLRVAERYIRTDMKELADMWIRKALKVVCKPAEYKLVTGSTEDYLELRSHFLLYASRNLSRDVKYPLVSELMTDYRKVDLINSYPEEYFKLLEKGFQLVGKNTIIWYLKKRWDSEDYETLARCVPHGKTAPSRYYLGLMYLNGKGMECDPDKAYKLIKKSYADGFDPAKYTLFDILWNAGNPKKYKEMLSYVSDGIDTGDVKSCKRLIKAYQEGKGTEVDQDKILEIRRILAKNDSWSKIELFDVLWKKGTEEAYREAFELVRNEPGQNAIGRRGMAYRDGKGVKQDYVAARECFIEASKSNPVWKKALKEMESNLLQDKPQIST